MWDEKGVERNGEHQIRMPVLVAGDDPQLIGSVQLPDGKGPTIGGAVVAESAKWGVGKDGAVPVMSLFDTTGANSGKKGV